MADHRTGDQRSAVASAPAEHAIDVAWNIETGGIRPISDSERHGKPSEMFWVWFAANMGITALPFGAYLVTFYSLNLTQAIFAAIIGCVLSYALVGDPVNLASRIQNLTKEFKVDILISDATRRRLDGSVPVEELPAVHVKGRVEDVTVYKVR